MLDITQELAEEIARIEKRKWKLESESGQSWHSLVSYAEGFLKHIENLEMEAMEKVKKDFAVNK